MYIYIYTNTHTHTFIYIYIYIYTHTHTYVYIYIYTYISLSLSLSLSLARSLYLSPYLSLSRFPGVLSLLFPLVRGHASLTLRACSMSERALLVYEA